MSDTEDSGFDKEAERQKLREKYEKEKADREATQHMSELLLQGATMTNKHCDTCGNPIFRQQGREFCPVCGEAAGEGAETAGSDQARATAGEGTEAAGDEAAEAQAAQSQAVEGDGAASGGQQAGQPSPQAAANQQTAAGQSATGQPAADGRPADRQAAGEAAGDLDEARAALVRTLTGLTREAEQSADVGRTRELLAAAREAAETLAALDRTGR